VEFPGKDDVGVRVYNLVGYLSDLPVLIWMRHIRRHEQSLYDPEHDKHLKVRRPVKIHPIDEVWNGFGKELFGFVLSLDSLPFCLY